MRVRSLAARVAPLVMGLAGFAVIGLHLPAEVAAAVAPADKCEATKAKTAGKHAKCRSGVYSSAIKKGEASDAAKLLKCSDKITVSFTKAEDKAAGACPTTDDATAVEDVVDACVDGVLADLGGVPGPGGDEAKCQASKVKEAGSYADCRLKALAKGISKNLPSDFTKCEEKQLSKWSKLEEKPCSTMGDQASVKADIDACTTAVATAIDDIEDPLVEYSQDFEGLNQLSPSALSGDGWLYFANVFAPPSTFLYNYGPGGAPNGGAAFSGIDSGQGGAEQGLQQLVVYSDYNNGDHNNGNLIEANVFRERTIVAGDAGRTLTFAFDAKKGNITGATTAIAFIKVLKQSDLSYATLAFPTVNTTNLPTTWGGYSVTVDITPAMVGELIQFGFSSTATNYEPSGVFYDNIVVSTLTTP